MVDRKIPHVKSGLGFDVHRFTPRKKYLVLGGVKIACGFGVEAVSDGDVVLHAICDGICGAACIGDIGDYFPPGVSSSKDIKSTQIVRRIIQIIKKDFILNNIDVTIIGDRPPLAKHKKRMQESLKRIFKINSVNIKIKSKEGLDILGGRDSISCFALVTLVERC